MKSMAPGRRSPAALLRGRGGWLWILGLLAAVQVVFIAGHLAAFAATEGSSGPREARQLLNFNQEGSLPLTMKWRSLTMSTSSVSRPASVSCWRISPGVYAASNEL